MWFIRTLYVGPKKSGT